MLFVNMITIFDIANTVKMLMKVLFLSNLENKTGMNNPQIAIVKVNELTYNPEIAIDVLKYSAICDMIPTMLRGVFIPSVEIIRMYRSILGLVFMFHFPFFKIRLNMILFITHVIYS